MATYRKLSSGKYQAVIRKSGYPQKTKAFNTKAEAVQWSEEYESTIEQAVTSGSDYPFSEFIELYLQDCRTRLKRPDNEDCLWRINKSFLSRHTLFTLTPPAIETHKQKRLRSVTESTARKDLLFISRLYTFAQRRLHIDVKNPVKLVQLTKNGRARDRIASPEEQRLILDNITPKMKPVFIVAIETAMRRSELSSIRWEWLDLRNKRLVLPEEITKNGTSRDVPLSSTAISIFEQLGIKDKGLIFNVKSEGISTAMYRACIRAGIKDLRFHDLRHTSITKYAKKGLSTAQLRVISGHKTLSQLSRYVNLTANDVAGLMG